MHIPVRIWYTEIIAAMIWTAWGKGGKNLSLWHNFWGHLGTVSHHRALVFVHCCRAGIPWQGLWHDFSKFSPVEFWAGVRYYQGDHSPNEEERRHNGYSAAWLHHKGRNRHHLEYWIDYSAGGPEPLAGVQMPPRFVAEMICDRIAASKTYRGSEYTDRDPWDYYERSKGHYMLHPETRAQMEKAFLILRDEGEDALFQYVRSELLHK